MIFVVDYQVVVLLYLEFISSVVAIELSILGKASAGIAHRSIESLARIYPQIEDETLPWSIGLAPYEEYRAPTFYEEGEDFNELESTAIRMYAPIFYILFPSKSKSQGKELKIKHIAEVFTDVDYPCTAFESDNLEKQAIETKNNQSPPWQQGNKRRRKWNSNTNQYE